MSIIRRVPQPGHPDCRGLHKLRKVTIRASGAVQQRGSRFRLGHVIQGQTQPLGRILFIPFLALLFEPCLVPSFAEIAVGLARDFCLLRCHRFDGYAGRAKKSSKLNSLGERLRAKALTELDYRKIAVELRREYSRIGKEKLLHIKPQPAA